MRPWLPTLLALTLTTATQAEDEAPRPRKLPALSLLPNGSELKGVVIPRHDEQRRLTGSLEADVITLLNDKEVAGTRVTIDFFNNDGTQRAEIKLAQATFNQLKGMLESDDPVTINAEKFKAEGKGLHYDLRQGEGFLVGPATTWIKKIPETAKKLKTSSLIGATGIALVAQTGATTAQDEAAKANDPVMVNTVDESPVATARAAARQQLSEDLEASDKARQQAKTFLDDTTIGSRTLITGEKTRTHSKPLDMKTGPDDTVVNCDGGMYFDADDGLLVYLKNVRVDDPRYTLKGAEELKIFLTQEQKPAASKPESAENGSQKSGIGSRFNKVDRIVATGAVRVVQRAVEKGKEPVQASGEVFTFHPETGDIIISGGYPWVMQGNFFARAKQANLTLRMKKDGSFVTEGQWEMGGRLNSN